MQRSARENIQRILKEQENLSHELESKKRRIDDWNKQLNRREALTELERQKLNEDKQKVILSDTLNYSRETANAHIND